MAVAAGAMRNDVDRLGIKQALPPLNANLRQQDVLAIAQQLFIVHVGSPYLMFLRVGFIRSRQLDVQQGKVQVESCFCGTPRVIPQEIF